MGSKTNAEDQWIKGETTIFKRITEKEEDINCGSFAVAVR